MISPEYRAYCGGMSRIAASSLLSAALFLGAVAGAGLAVVPAMAQSDDLVYRQRTEERLAGLDRQLRDMTGVVEQLQFRLRNAERRIAALEARLADSSPPSAPAPAAETPAAETSATASDDGQPGGALPSGKAQTDYDAAYGLLSQGRFAVGEAAFRAFLENYPDHKLVGNARYWIAESLYARQRYQQSATAFLEAWRDDQRGVKAPDNLLKLGMSLMRLDKTDEACASFDKLLSDYRGAPERLRTAAQRERRSLGCS